MKTMEEISMQKVKWGVLGTADIARGQTIPGMMLAEHCERYAIAGRRIEKAKSYQEEFGFQKAYGSYDELLADPEVQAVYIPLPNDIHCEWTVKALKAKKHVLCEKPLALCEAQVKEMFAAAEENGVLLMEAFAYQHSPVVAAIKAEIDSGAVGELRWIDSAFIGGRRPDTDIRMKKENYGGAQYDLGCYPVSMILRMTGREPKQVLASGYFSEGGVDLGVSALMLFDGDLAAQADCAMVSGIGRLDRFHVLGTEGEIHSPVEFNQGGRIPYTVVRGGKAETKTVDVKNNYQLEVEQLGRCIAEGEAPFVTKEFSLMCARTTDRILGAIGY
jgi:predicted dehydrogenase